MEPEPLLTLARALAAGTASNLGRPAQHDLKTAINRTYYALFHALANIAADAVMGQEARRNKDPAWLQTARGLDHNTAKRECNRIASQSQLTQGARQFAQTFSSAQINRHEADYNDYSRYTRTQVTRWIDEAEQAIQILKAEPTQTRRALATMAMHRQRSS